MKMIINPEAVLEEAAGKTNKRQLMLYLNSDTIEQTKAICKKNKIPVSKLVETLLKMFISSVDK